MDNPNSNPYSEENEFELYKAYNKGYEQGLLDSGSLNAQNIWMQLVKYLRLQRELMKQEKLQHGNGLKIITQYALIVGRCARHI